MKLERTGLASFRLTLHAYELATLTSAARWVADGADGKLPDEARAQIRTFLADYESRLSRITDQGADMAGIASKSFDTPDERRAPDKTQLDVVDLGSVKAARMTLQPGWRWSECVKPVVGTDSCQVHHIGTAASGRIHVEHEDGTTLEIGAGDAYVIEPGHDAWVVGSEPFVGYEFDSKAVETFAQS